MRHLRYAARRLAATPQFTIVALVSLSFGIALCATTVSVVNAYLLRQLPYPGADRLYNISYTRQGESRPRGVSRIDWMALSDVVEMPLASAAEVLFVTDGGYTQQAIAAYVGPGYLEGLGIR